MFVVVHKGFYKKIMILMIQIQKEKLQSNLWRLKINGTCGLYICLFYYLPLSLFVNFVMLYLCVLKIFFDSLIIFFKHYLLCIKSMRRKHNKLKIHLFLVLVGNVTSLYRKYLLHLNDSH